MLKRIASYLAIVAILSLVPAFAGATTFYGIEGYDTPALDTETIESASDDSFYGLFVWVLSATPDVAVATGSAAQELQTFAISMGILFSIIIALLTIGVFILLYGIYKGKIRLKF